MKLVLGGPAEVANLGHVLEMLANTPRVTIVVPRAMGGMSRVWAFSLLLVSACSEHGGEPRSVPFPPTEARSRTRAPRIAPTLVPLVPAPAAEPTKADPRTPKRIEPLGLARSVSSGNDHDCAILRDGTAACWGANDKGQLGDGTRAPSEVPRPVPGLVEVRSLITGSQFTCAIHHEGDLACWGDYPDYPVGDADGVALPHSVTTFGPVSAMAGFNHYLCALRNTGAVVCLGQGMDPAGTEPHVVRLPGPASSITVGDFGGCAVVSHQVVCWGAGSITAWDPRPGRPTPERVLEPTLLRGTNDAARVDIYSLETCLVTTHGAAWCWRNESETLLPVNPLLPAQRVEGVDDAIDVSGSTLLRASHEVVMVDVDSESGRPHVVPLENGMGAAVAVSRRCAVDANGAVWCWDPFAYP